MKKAATRIKEPPPEQQQPSAEIGPWRNRILGSGEESPEQLLANPMNFRKHPSVQQNAMKGALEDLGFIQQVVVNKRTGHIVDGHLRVELAMRHQAERIPVLYVDLSEEEELLALATLDPIGQLAATDRDQLTALLAQLPEHSEHLQPLIDDLARQAKGLAEVPREGRTDPNAIPPLDKNQKRVKVGQVWQMGPHRLAVGDSRDRVLVEALMNGEQADMLWSDPPYGVEYVSADGKSIQNDELHGGQLQKMLHEAFSTAALVVKPGGAMYVCHGDSERVAFQNALTDAGWLVKQCLIWIKNSAVLSRQDYNWRHEPVLYGWRDGGAHYYAFNFTETTVVDVPIAKLQRPELEALCSLLLGMTTTHPNDRPQRNDIHPTMKPVELIERHLRNSSRRGEIVLDPFAGSGSTLIAAERLYRKARVVELDPTYAAAAIKRWEEHVGEQAVLRS